MSDPALFRLRFHFRKTGRLAQLSHLEVAHALERAVRRAGLPFAVSQGFSPHMRIAFGAALSVGVGGTDEMFDLLLTEYVAPQKALSALEKTSVEDLMVFRAYYVEHNATAASVGFPFSTYEVVVSGPVQNLTVPQTLTVVRKKKEKTIEVGEFLQGSIAVEPCDEGSKLTFTLEAKASGSLRPDLLVSETLQASGYAGLRVLSLTRISQAVTFPRW